MPHGFAHDLVLGILEHIAHALRRCPHIHVGDGLAQHAQFASALARRSDLGLEQRQQRRLTRSGTANKQRKCTLGNRPVEPLEHRSLSPGVGKAQTPYLNRRHIRAARPARYRAAIQPRATHRATPSKPRTQYSQATAPAPKAEGKTNTALSRPTPPQPQRRQTAQAPPARQRRCAPVDTAHTSYDASRHPTRASASCPRAPANLPCPSPSTRSMPVGANARDRPARDPAHQSHPAPPVPYDRGAKTVG